jgi:hypothetical protein
MGIRWITRIMVGLVMAVVASGCGSTITRTVTVTRSATTVTTHRPRSAMSGSTGMPTVNAFLAIHMQDLKGSTEAEPHNRNERVAAEHCQLPASRTGILIEQVAAGSPAQKAGLEGGKKIYSPPPGGGTSRFVAFIGGDVITAINGRAVSDLATLVPTVEKLKAGQSVKVTVLPCRGPRRTAVVKLVDAKQSEAINQQLAAATPPSASDTPQPDASAQTRPISRRERDALLSATDVPKSDFHSFCIGAWASESDENFATYEISGSPSCDSLSEKLGDNTTILERQPTGGWRVVFTGTGPKTTCKHAPGIPTVVAIDFDGCPGQY